MTPPPEESLFEKKIRERREREAQEKAKQQEAQPFDNDLVPQSEYDRSEADIEIDNLIQGIGIIEAYQRWCGKMTPKVIPGQVENIMISCPMPDHADLDPSAWINTEKNAWNCGKCELGGDVFDLAAIYFGMWMGETPRSYKEGANFHRLREAIAKDYGWTLTRTTGGDTVAIPPELSPEQNTQPEAPPAAQAPDAPTEADIIDLFVEDDDTFDSIEMPTLDWRRVCPPETFLDEYMKATIIDDAPEEYHFFHALIAIGFALGRNVSLYDSVPIPGNLFICTLGRSGTGKSKSRRHLDKLLQFALPEDRSNLSNTSGVRRVSAPASAEVLIHAFQKEEADPNNPKIVVRYPVKGIIDFNELSSLIARARRQGSAIIPTLMQFYDMEDVVSTRSMTTGIKEATEPFASALTTSQPRALKTLVDQQDDASGFLNRWLFVPGKEKPPVAVGGARVDLSDTIKPLQEILGWAGSFRTGELMQWSDGALALFEDFFHSTIVPIKKQAQNDLYVRIDLLMKKMILLFAANRHEKNVTEQSVRDAIFCFPFLKDSYGVLAGQMGNTVDAEIQEVILNQCKKHAKEGISESKLWDNIKHRKYQRKRVHDNLELLVKMGHIEEFKQNAGRVGRPTVRYRAA